MRSLQDEACAGKLQAFPKSGFRPQLNSFQANSPILAHARCRSGHKIARIEKGAVRRPILYAYLE
jgi:hypothetical protein